MGTNSFRPVISDYRAIAPYLRAMYSWCKIEEPAFSVRKEAGYLQRCSPALVTRVLQGKRKLTIDRVGDFARLFRLNSDERAYLHQWVGSSRAKRRSYEKSLSPMAPAKQSRRTGQNHLLSDWLNVYVKDSCRLKGFEPDALVVHRLLGGIATPSHIGRALRFLFREGYLRRTLDGKIVENESLITTTDGIPNRKIRSFHKKALEIAKRGLDLYPVERRRECALILRLDGESLSELRELLKDFYSRLLAFAGEHASESESLYQVTIHLTPMGGSQ